MSHPVRLPTYLTSFIGREREQEAVLLLLHSVRLLTLLGPGGSGKTRLAAEVVRCTDAFPDGVWFVRLADVADPQLVLSTIAHALAVPLGGAVASLDALAAWIADQRILLALDNLEQVAGAAPQLAQLLVAAPRLTILVTSRAALHVAGEQLFPLSPLPVPASVDPRVIAQNQAVQLFVARARAVRPDFSLTPNAALDVAAICRRLDGLPLAIELAAARIRLLPPTLLRKRLDQSLDLLTSGPVDTPARHQTLRAAIDWSYLLLDPVEQQVLRRLAVFVGGCTPEALEAVIADASLTGIELLDRLQSLVDQSLLLYEMLEPQPRLRLLETIRAYAFDQLVACAEIDEARQRHCAYFLHLAEQSMAALYDNDQTVWLDRLDAEIDNLRAAMEYVFVTRDRAAQLRFGCALPTFWRNRGHVREGLAYLRRSLQQIETEPQLVQSDLYGQALISAALLAWDQGEYPEGRRFGEAALDRFRARGDQAGIMLALRRLALIAYNSGDCAAARRYTEECLMLEAETSAGRVPDRAARLRYAAIRFHHARVAFLQGMYPEADASCREALQIEQELGNLWRAAVFATWCAPIALELGDRAGARALAAEGMQLARQVGARRDIAYAMYQLAMIDLLDGKQATASDDLHEALALLREAGDLWGCMIILNDLAALDRTFGRYEAAIAAYRESIAIQQRIGSTLATPESLEGIAGLALDLGQFEHAAQLLGAAAALRAQLGMPLRPSQQPRHQRDVQHARRQLGANLYAVAVAVGHAMSAAQMLALARRSFPITPPHSAQRTATPPQPHERETLTEREIEVLRLVASGLSNQEVAARLYLSVNTVQSHLRSIYGKLGVTSRNAATRYAWEHQILGPQTAA